MSENAEQAEQPYEVPTTDATEPVRNTSAITSAATLLVNGVVLFNVLTLSDDQKMWIITAVAFFGPLVAGYFARGKVFSPATVHKMIAGLRRDLDMARAETVAVREAASTNAAMDVARRRERARQKAQEATQAAQEDPATYPRLREYPGRDRAAERLMGEPETEALPVQPPRREPASVELARRRARFLAEEPPSYPEENTAQPSGYYQDYDERPRRHRLSDDRYSQY